MFLGYQKELLACVADTREELENNPFIVFDRIEESPETYELFNGKYYPANNELIAAKNEEIRKQRQSWYEQHTDPLTARKLRRQVLGQWTEEDEAAFAAEIERLMIELEQKFPYLTLKKEETSEEISEV